MIWAIDLRRDLVKRKYSSLLKNIGLFTIGNFGSKIVSFLMVPLYTAILSTSDYGTVDLITSTVSLVMPIMLLSIQDATLRFGMDDNYKKEDVISTSFKTIFRGSIILLSIIVVVYSRGLLDLPFAYYVFFFLTFILNAINNVLGLYLKAKNKASIIAISGILCTLISCVSNVVCLVFLKLGINGFMISNTLGIGVQVLYQLFLGATYKDIHLKKYNDLTKPMVKYSSPLIANSIAWWINNASDRYILSWILGIAANGIYSVAYKIPTILTMFQGIFYNAWSISAISEFDEGDTDGFIGNNYTLYSFISIVGCSAIILINMPLASILYSGDYFSAWKCVPFLLLGTVFNGISQFEGSLFAAVKQTKKVSLTTIFGAIVNTIFNLLLIKPIGIVGAAFATMVGYLVTWIMRTVFLRSFVRMKVNWIKHISTLLLLLIQTIAATLNVAIVFQFLIFVLIITIYAKNILRFLETCLSKK